MRQSPSQKQIEYLRSIGAWNDNGAEINQVQDQRAQLSKRNVLDNIKWWLVALLCVVVLLAIASATHATGTSKTTIESCSATEEVPVIHADFEASDSQTASNYALSNEVSTDNEISDEALIILLMIVVLFAASYGVNWRITKHLITEIQRIAISVAPLPVSQFRDEKSAQPSSAIPKKYIHRLTQSEVPSPEQVIQLLADFAQGSPLISHIPLRPSWSWSIGFATHAGNVRKENQDYVTCFRVGNYDALICADGLGGLPKGQQASFLAVFETAKSIIEQLGASSWRPIRLERVIKRALSQAHHILTAYGDKLSISDINGGLRTTLIIALAKDREVHYGYIGDGAIDVLHTTGQLESLMIPHKHGQLLNVLSASLGPQQQGHTVIGHIERRPGDLLIISTDGIADRIDAPEFARDIMCSAIHNNGDLHAVANQTVGELAKSKDDLGYICDDNLTLALLGTGQAPVLAPGFWKKPLSVSGEHVDDSESDEAEGSTISDAERASI